MVTWSVGPNPTSTSKFVGPSLQRKSMTSWRGDVELVCLPILQDSGVTAIKQLVYGETRITLGFDPGVLGSIPSRPAKIWLMV